MFWILLLYAGFASVFTFGKAATEVASPLFLVGSRMMIAGACMLAFSLWQLPCRLNRRQLLCLGLLSLCNIYLTNVLEFWALKHLSSLKTCFFYSLSPFISALVAFFMLEERLSRQQWIGLSIGFLGFLPLFTVQEGGSSLELSLPDLAMFGAVLASVCGWIFLKQATHTHQIPPLLANGVSMFTGGSLALIHSSLIESWSPLPVSDWFTFLWLSAALILISNFFCYNLYGYLLKRFSATFLSFAGFVTPFFTAVYGYLFLGEITPSVFYLSATIVFCGLFTFYREELQPATVREAQSQS